MTKIFGIFLWPYASGFARYKFCGIHLWLCTHGSTQYKILCFLAAPPPLMQAVMPMPPPHVSNIIQIK